jgi:hypoxanthine phosphoribosyltransferase
MPSHNAHIDVGNGKRPDKPVLRKDMVDGQPLISKESIGARAEALFGHIRRDFAKHEFTLVLYITHGSVMSAFHLLDELPDTGIVSHPIQAKSYFGTERKGITINLNDLHPALLDFCKVLLVDDIVDTGETLGTVLKALEKLKPKISVKTFAMFSKPGVLSRHNEQRRARGETEVEVDYVGFDVPDDAFVIGRGMDYYGFGRRHKCIYTFEDWTHRFSNERAAAERLKESVRGLSASQ